MNNTSGQSLPRFAEPDAIDVREVSRAIDKGLFFYRIVAPLPIMLVIYVQRDIFTQWLPLMAVIAAMLVYNLAIVMPTMRRWPRISRTAGFTLDTAILIASAFLTVPDLAGRDVTVDFWLIYIVYIILSAFYFGPLAGLVYTLTLSGFFAVLCYRYFPADSITYQNIWVREIFFVLIAGLVYWLSYELSRRRVYLERANQTLRGQNHDTLMLLAALVEARDSFTGSHLMRVRAYTEILALEHGLSQPDAIALGEASITHDLGKAYVPDAVLKKPGRFTPEERAIMERHTVDGEKILGGRPAFRLHRQIARWHHEKWDGTGYPDRLQGDRIPLPARIVAVADVYDALTTRRPYKDPWESATAAEETLAESGSPRMDGKPVKAMKTAIIVAGGSGRPA